MAESHPRTREVDLLGHPVEYEVRHSGDASQPRIDIDIHGVTVIVPANDDAEPKVLLKENAAWVVEKHRQFEAYRADAPDRTFEAGEQFPYLGADRELVVESRPGHAVTEDQIKLRRSAVAQSSVKRVLENFYRERARDHFTARADHFAQEMGVEYEQIEIRNQRTKWGSCSTTGTLGLNWRLMMAPPGIVDYIVVHELAHLSEQNHTDRFWELVAAQLPDYEEHISWLEENSTTLIYTNDDL